MHISGQSFSKKFLAMCLMVTFATFLFGINPAQAIQAPLCDHVVFGAGVEVSFELIGTQWVITVRNLGRIVATYPVPFGVGATIVSALMRGYGGSCILAGGSAVPAVGGGPITVAVICAFIAGMTYEQTPSSEHDRTFTDPSAGGPAYGPFWGNK